MRRSRATRWVGYAAALLCAADVDAYSAHSLNALAGNESDSSNTIADTFVEKLVQVGVPGVNDGALFAHARADSDTGLLLAESLIDAGPEIPTTTITIAGIEQWLDVVEGDDPVTVDFTLTTSLSAQWVEGTPLAEAAARLDVTSLCNVYVEVKAGQDTEVIDNCTEDYGSVSFQASASADALHVRAIWQSDAVPTHIDFLAQVENELGSVTGARIGQTFASGALSISVAGAQSHSFTSPTFLTVPEPGGSAAGAVALGAIAAAARRRRA